MFVNKPIIHKNQQAVYTVSKSVIFKVTKVNNLLSDNWKYTGIQNTGLRRQEKQENVNVTKTRHEVILYTG